MNNDPQPQSKPWQLEMFQRSLKKQQKLKALLNIHDNFDGLNCLLITCGDNNGALNWYFRSNGGAWSWADVSNENLDQMREFLGENVQHADPDKLPFGTSEFNCIISIDVLEHLENDRPFLLEINRILKPDGIFIVTVPNGDPKLLANQVKDRIGMKPEQYGHTRAGYSLHELEEVTLQAGFVPTGYGGYSRFFTEMMELIINYGYVFILSRNKTDISKSHIAPTTIGELKTHGTAYRLYSLVFPILKAISFLDVLLPTSTNNAVIIKATKPSSIVGSAL
jgi:2-polyprenyl-3-methyl-5-hydroxy-6-metoxy-1,4-benzoquinol methylase